MAVHSPRCAGCVPTVPPPAQKKHSGNCVDDKLLIKLFCDGWCGDGGWIILDAPSGNLHPRSHKLKAKEDSFKRSTEEIGRHRKESQRKVFILYIEGRGTFSEKLHTIKKLSSAVTSGTLSTTPLLWSDSSSVKFVMLCEPIKSNVFLW